MGLMRGLALALGGGRAALGAMLPCEEYSSGGNDGDAFDCVGNATVPALTAAEFLVNGSYYHAANWSNLHTLDINLTVGESPGTPGAPTVSATTSVNRSFTSESSANGWLSDRLVCRLPGPQPIVTTVRSSEEAQLRLKLSLRPLGEHGLEETDELTVRDYRSFISFWRIKDEDAAAGEVRVTVDVVDSDSNSTLQAFITSENSSCIQRMSGTGCFSSKQLGSCLQQHALVGQGLPNVRPESLSFSVSTKATVTLNPRSALRLQPGVWMVVLLLTPDSTAGRYRVSMRAGQSRPPLWISALLMLLLPLCGVGLVFAVNQACKRWFRRDDVCKSPLPILKELLCMDASFRSFLKDKLTRMTSKESYLALVLVGGGAFLSAAMQIAMGLWVSMHSSGNLDMCYYNFQCYVPRFLDLPANNIISHIPYIVCGSTVIFTVMHLEKASETNVQPGAGPPPDLGVFYALGAAVIMEAFGSAAYHICPTAYVFQFDTSMMFVIAMLSTLALVDGDAEQGGTVTPVALLLFLILPMWLTSFIGTWFDFLIPKNDRSDIVYVIYAALVMIWTLFLLYQASLLFPRREEERGTVLKGLLLLRILVGLLVLVMLIFRQERKDVGGMSNVLLFTSMLAMSIVTIRQMVRHDRSRGDLRVLLRCDVAWRDLSRRMVSAALMAGFAAVSVVALMTFADKSTNVEADPASSRAKNQDCVLWGTFDEHDLWHMLSAVALALWILLLAETRLRIASGGKSPSEGLLALNGGRLEPPSSASGLSLGVGHGSC